MCDSSYCRGLRTYVLRFFVQIRCRQLPYDFSYTAMWIRRSSRLMRLKFARGKRQTRERAPPWRLWGREWTRPSRTKWVFSSVRSAWLHYSSPTQRPCNCTQFFFSFLSIPSLIVCLLVITYLLFFLSSFLPSFLTYLLTYLLNFILLASSSSSSPRPFFNLFAIYLFFIIMDARSASVHVIFCPCFLSFFLWAP